MTEINPTIRDTVMSQYANSPNLLAIINGIANGMAPEKFVNDFFNTVMRLKTAKGFGLDIWGVIVGIKRSMTFANPEGEYLGFDSGFFPFSQRPFFTSGGGNTWDLTDDAYRELIFIKAAANIIYATLPNINLLMKQIFSGKAYALKSGHMKIRFIFEYNLNAFERHLIYNTNLLPRPCGVEVEAFDIIPPETFGFSGTGFAPFGQGTFYNANA